MESQARKMIEDLEFPCTKDDDCVRTHYCRFFLKAVCAKRVNTCVCA